jgi:hypothetical protein
MERERTDLHFSKGQEKRLLNAAAAAIGMDFPNPERLGCPEPYAIRDLAYRQTPLMETGELVDHIATCAPCFDAYSLFRRRRRLSRAGGTIMLAAGVLAFALLWHHALSPIPHPQLPAAGTAAPPVERATLDYREISPTRTVEPHLHIDKAPDLPKANLDLTILLPLGTEDGEYLVEVRTLSGDVVSHAMGRAEWNGSAETLATKLDLRNLGAGRYSLALRATVSSWHVYPLNLQNVK